MKKVLAISFFLILSLISTSFAGNDSTRRKQYNNSYKKNHYQEQNKKHHYQERYNQHNGYRSHPFGDRQAYHEYYNGYHYRGHWRSWNDWENYKRHYPNYSRHGKYVKMNNHLYFMFDNGIETFMFSIGR